LFGFADRAFEAYFAAQRNLDDVAVLIEIANGCGLDGNDLARRAQTEEIKQRLRANTQEVVDRGGYGSPTLFVDGTEMYFGNDQLPLVEQALKTGSA
jgi:2-hydroxychromene-2-carboxylate isomerase